MASSFFLEGLLTARDLIRTGNIEKLDQLIAEHQAGSFETAAVVPNMETR